MDTIKLRAKLEESGMKSEDIDEITSVASGTDPVTEEVDPRSQIEALKLTLDAAPDWQSRAKIAAQIISLELEL